MVEKHNIDKICIAIHDLAHAGAERVAVSWANYLAGQGYTVSIVVYAPIEDAYYLDDRVRVVPLAETRNQFAQLSNWKRLSCIRRSLRQEKPDLLISFLPKMQIMMMLGTLGMRMKRIETIRNNPWIDKDVAGNRMLWNLCFQRSDKIVVQTKEQSLYFSRRLQKKCVVISNPISGDFSARMKNYSGGKIKKCVAVARINTQKNYPMMIQAFAQVVQSNPECSLDIYGAGAPKTVHEIQKLINELGMEKHIQLCGWRRDISSLLLQYDAFLMSSDYEGMPNALAEAMATGLVCLSTDCRTGPKDMIEDGVNGFLAKTGDVHSFAERIKTILQMNQQQCAAMGEAARNKILHMCSEENTLVRLKQLIESEL